MWPKPILALAAFAAGIFLGAFLATMTVLYSVWWQSGAGE
jgi:hypothetical protein